ncbi:MAG TPA: hypothetical protein VNZ64_14465 [Candidatus Acidoferrum sp.]|jgi:hypothetical protein|nr:hypothetical protein [Candidatus Acidoferrum sp.]
MKRKTLGVCRTGALIAIGVFLGRGAHADTTLTFDSDAASCTPPQMENPNAPPGITNFGNYAAISSGGVTVSGFGTPNIGLRWSGSPWPDTRWEYYNAPGTPWAGAVQLQDSFVGSTEELTFIPNNPSARVTVESFSFDAYYNDKERFTYQVSVVSGTNVLSGPTTVSYLSDATKNHPVNINYTGLPGQSLKLQLLRVPSTLGAGESEGNAYNNAVDDIAFAQTPATTFPAGPQVVSVTPPDGTSGLPATSVPPYAAIITNGPTLTVANPIQLKLDYSLVSPPPTVTSLGGGLTSVTYPGATSVGLTSGPHVYTLTYADNLGGFYTNEVEFITSFTTLPAAYALPPGSGVTRGFNFRLVSAYSQAFAFVLDSSIARAVAQLNGTLINTNTGQPYTNDAVLGPNPDGSYNVDTVINFNGDGFDEGDFTNDVLFPGLPTGGASWYSTEALLFLDLPAGYYRFGVNSDDGFEVNALPPQGVSGSPMVLGLFDGGRGAADTLFDFQVTTSGVYPFQVIYFQSTGRATEEFFSVTNLVTGDKILINDPNYSNAIKSYRALKPRLTHIARNGPNAVVDWAYGTPPFQLQFKSSLTAPVWSNIGAPTTNQTATVPIQPGAGFFRVSGQ